MKTARDGARVLPVVARMKTARDGGGQPSEPYLRDKGIDKSQSCLERWIVRAVDQRPIFWTLAKPPAQGITQEVACLFLNLTLVVQSMIEEVPLP